MKRQLNIYLVVFVLVSVLLVFIFWNRNQTVSVLEPADSIKIGFIGPLTGDAAQWGIPPYRGAQLAIEEINKNGGVHGSMLELIAEDSACDPRRGVDGFNKVIADPRVHVVIGGVCSGVTLAIAPIAEEHGIVLISPGSTSPNITTAGDYVFRIVPSDSLRGEVFAHYVFDDLHLKRVGYLYMNNESGLVNYESFKEVFDRLGGVIINVQQHEQDSIDVETPLLKISLSDPEAIVVVTHFKDALAIMKQVKESGINLPLFFQTEAVDDQSVIDSAGQSAEGIQYILSYTPESRELQSFIDLYTLSFDDTPGVYAPEGYDIINLVVTAINSPLGSDNSQLIKDYLYNVHDYHGASGIITFDENGDVQKPMAIMKILDGHKELVTVK